MQWMIPQHLTDNGPAGVTSAQLSGNRACTAPEHPSLQQLQLPQGDFSRVPGYSSRSAPQLLKVALWQQP
jgi:hypothetical protein